MPKIAAVALRNFNRNGESFAKGQKLSLTEGEFEQLGPDGIGFVDAAPVKAAAKAKPV